MKGVAYIELPPLGKVQSDRSGSALTWGAGVESRASLNETAGERVGRGMPSCSPGAGRSQENSADLSPGGSGVRHWMCWVYMCMSRNWEWIGTYYTVVGL